MSQPQPLPVLPAARPDYDSLPQAEIGLLPTDPHQPFPLNELFGPTIQGEGPMIGRPCLFLRLHGCPVRCPGCDTHYTWDGSEAAVKTTTAEVARRVHGLLDQWPGTGLVVSGGEPLIHQGHAGLISLLATVMPRQRWISLETSGIAGGRVEEAFLHLFDSVTLSPKITPCLQGTLSIDRLIRPLEFMTHMLGPARLCFKFVVRDADDLRIVEEADLTYGLTARGYQVFLMPYGILQDEVLEAARSMVPMLARTGYTLSPRLHAMMWGKTRGV